MHSPYRQPFQRLSGLDAASREEGKTKKGGRIRRRRKEGRKEKEKCEDEGDGKSKVKPVTEWAGMTDWVVAVRRWMLGSGEEDKRWEGQKVGGNQEPSGSRILDQEAELLLTPHAAWSKPLFALLAQSPIMIGSLMLIQSDQCSYSWGSKVTFFFGSMLLG